MFIRKGKNKKQTLKNYSFFGKIHIGDLNVINFQKMGASFIFR